MALVLVQIAVITYWFTLADDSNGDAGRDAQIYALQGLGRRTIGSLRAGYDQAGAYNRWIELNTLARSAEQKGDVEGAQRLRAARDRVAKLSPALQPPYFDSSKDIAPRLAAYEAETYIRESTALAERFANQYRLKVQWSDKASSYTVQLTLLAVALFMFGVIANSQRRVRILFFGIGLGLTLIVFGWMLLTYLRPVTALPDAAIEAYARGAAALYQNDAQQALKEYDTALSLAPTYVNAYRDRAYAKYISGDAAGAANDLMLARANGDSSSDVVSSLGFLYYTLGRFNDANALNKEGLTDSNEIWVRFNYALGLLASGEIENARAEYDVALKQAAQQVEAIRAQGKEVSPVLWFQFDDGAKDLQALLVCASQQSCTGSPPYSALKNPDEIARVAQELITTLKENSVALEYTSKPPAGSANVTIEPFQFSRQLTEEAQPIQATDTFTATDEPIYMAVRFQGFRDGQQIVIKLYVDGYEDDRLRVVDEYSSVEMGGADGDITLPITTGGVPLTPGNYQVEMYVDSRLVQRGNFRVVQ